MSEFIGSGTILQELQKRLKLVIKNKSITLSKLGDDVTEKIDTKADKSVVNTMDKSTLTVKTTDYVREKARNPTIYSKIIVVDSNNTLNAVILPKTSAGINRWIYQNENGWRVVKSNLTIPSSATFSDLLERLYTVSAPIGEGDVTKDYVDTELLKKADKEDLENVLFFDEEIDAPDDKDVIDKVNDLATDMGSLADLETTAKSNLVAAINEARQSGGGSGSTPMVSLTYAQLKAKRDAGELVAGTQYQITDYATTTITSNTQSAGHAFDVIVVADSASTLNEDARAILHSGDEYFASCDLNAWELKYCLDNDTTRFAWADATNGKGVIYRMKDEWGNDIPYDFKNIQYLNDTSYVYTFGGSTDGSLAGGCRDNVMGKYAINTKQNLNFTIFGTGCVRNTIGNDCHYNTFGRSCSRNIIGDYCQHNTFDNVCLHNTIGNDCRNNTFGSYCQDNIFGSYCQGNTFGSLCRYNTLGIYCYYNKFGNDSDAKSYYQYITLESGVQYSYIDCTQTTSSSARLQNIHICSGVAGTSSAYKTITIPTTNNSFLTTVYLNESGTLCYEKSGEVASKVEDIGLNKLDKPTASGTSGQVLGLDDDLSPKWVDQSGGGGYDGMELLEEVTIDSDVSSLTIKTTKQCTELYLFMDESGIEGTTYSSPRAAVIDSDGNAVTRDLFIVNISNRYKHLFVKSFDNGFRLQGWGVESGLYYSTEPSNLVKFGSTTRNYKYITGFYLAITTIKAGTIIKLYGK